jgi:hypothetical protein
VVSSPASGGVADHPTKRPVERSLIGKSRFISLRGIRVSVKNSFERSSLRNMSHRCAETTKLALKDRAK